MRTKLPVSNLRLVWIVLLLLFIPGLFGIFHPGFFASDDGNWMVIRFSAFYEALRSGQFPVRFLPRLLNGYGYPVSDFLYPLFMYIGVPIHIVGINFVSTIKVLFGLSFIFSGIFSFLWLRRLFSSIAALVGAIAYIYFPYHLFDMYKRGSLGELLALCIVPFILLQITKKQNLLVGLGIGLLILSHNTLAILFLPILLIYYFLHDRNFMNVLVALIIGLGIGAFFWIPALIDKQYTIFDTKTISVSSEYFLTTTSYYLVGIIGILGFILLVFGIVKKQVLAVFWGIVFLLSLYFALPASQFLWHILPLTKYVQFPFRFLSITGVAISFASSYIISISKPKYKTIFICGLGVLILISALPVLFPQTYQLYPDGWYSTNEDSTTVQNEYLPMWVENVPTDKTHIAQVVKGEGRITTESQRGSKIILTTDSEKSMILQINTIYYPGWEVKMDNKKISIVYSNTQGLMQVALPPGSHMIKAIFVETPVRLIADNISLLTLLLLVVFALVQHKFVYRK